MLVMLTVAVAVILSFAMAWLVIGADAMNVGSRIVSPGSGSLRMESAPNTASSSGSGSLRMESAGNTASSSSSGSMRRESATNTALRSSKANSGGVVRSRTVSAQSQCTYSRHLQNPRFKALRDSETGAWVIEG
eukprot:6492375-Amphidinium_carterae.3